jgi:hypothetical protein
MEDFNLEEEEEFLKPKELTRKRPPRKTAKNDSQIQQLKLKIKDEETKQRKIKEQQEYREYKEKKERESQLNPPKPVKPKPPPSINTSETITPVGDIEELGKKYEKLVNILMNISNQMEYFDLKTLEYFCSNFRKAFYKKKRDIVLLQSIYNGIYNLYAKNKDKIKATTQPSSTSSFSSSHSSSSSSRRNKPTSTPVSVAYESDSEEESADVDDF